MISHKLNTMIKRSGYLELKNLPFKQGTKIEIIICEKEKSRNLQKLISNDHVWSDDDIKAVEKGREIINQWKIC